MIIEEQTTNTDTRKFIVEKDNKFYLVYVPGVFNSMPMTVYELKDISGTKKGMEISLAVAQKVR